MKITATIKPNSKENRVEIDGENYLLRVKAPAKEGKANKVVVELLSEYFDIPKSAVTILKGLRGRNKIIEIGRSGLKCGIIKLTAGANDAKK